MLPVSAARSSKPRAGFIAERGVATLSLDGVAKEARLGVGTVYRRFGDRSGLIYALLGDHEREFHARFTAGPPPLGPGAPAADRMRPFLHALVDEFAAQRGLLLEAAWRAPTARLLSGQYPRHRFHLAMLSPVPARAWTPRIWLTRCSRRFHRPCSITNSMSVVPAASRSRPESTTCPIGDSGVYAERSGGRVSISVLSCRCCLAGSMRAEDTPVGTRMEGDKRGERHSDR
jgi:AcrR family transcriptional regulator